jgi:hypothetical protein
MVMPKQGDMCLICRCAIGLDFEQQKSQSKLTRFFV